MEIFDICLGQEEGTRVEKDAGLRRAATRGSSHRMLTLDSSSTADRSHIKHITARDLQERAKVSEAERPLAAGLI